LPCSGRDIATRMSWVHELLDQLEVEAAARARIWSGTAAAWLGPALRRRADHDDELPALIGRPPPGWLSAAHAVGRYCC
jgi:hypothetical protein